MKDFFSSMLLHDWVLFWMFVFIIVRVEWLDYRNVKNFRLANLNFHEVAKWIVEIGSELNVRKDTSKKNPVGF